MFVSGRAIGAALLFFYRATARCVANTNILARAQSEQVFYYSIWPERATLHASRLKMSATEATAYDFLDVLTMANI